GAHGLRVRASKTLPALEARSRERPHEALATALGVAAALPEGACLHGLVLEEMIGPLDVLPCFHAQHKDYSEPDDNTPFPANRGMLENVGVQARDVNHGEDGHGPYDDRPEEEPVLVE